jgi:alkanesulfonate monooxygenase SsuD/methylene tetrahydromethanopterin reductase-like flavin-dependent oxidoreductase (luciferase family)
MSKTKEINKLQSPTVREWAGRKLMSWGHNSRHHKQNNTHESDVEHNHKEHEHGPDCKILTLNYIALVVDDTVVEVLQGNDALKELFLSNPTPIYIDPEKYPEVRPTIGWKYIDGEFTNEVPNG